MTIYEVFGFLMIIGMMALVFVATRFVSGKKYNGKGIWHIVVNAYLRNKSHYKQWLHYNMVYLWSVLLILVLIVTILGLIGSFSHSKMFDRPKLILIVSPIVWLSIYKCYSWFVKKLRMSE